MFLVIRRSCDAQAFKSNRLLLLHFSTPILPMIPFRVLLPVRTLALKSARRVNLFSFGTPSMAFSKSSFDLL